mgnify:CR=1 FL=1
MSLSDVVGGAGLHSWTEIGLVLSFVTFIALLIWLRLAWHKSTEQTS